jgi:hypothetical protein
VAASVAAAAYGNALGNGFAYDDVQIVVDDENLADASALPGRLLEPYWPKDVDGDLGLWRPLTTATLAIQRQLVGLRPAVFHGVNLVLHGLVTALVVLLAAHFVPVPAAGLAGLLFAVHPVHVEAVANVVGLAELLSTALYLTACLLFLRGTRPDEEGPGSGTTAVLAGLYAAAFLTKESAVTLPAALVLLDLVRRPVAVRAVGPWLRRRGPVLLVLALTAGAVLAVRYSVLGTLASPDPPLGAQRLAEMPRIWTLAVVWLHMARLLVFPATLSADYSPAVIPLLTGWTPAAVAGALVALAALALALVAWGSSIGSRTPVTTGAGEDPSAGPGTGDARVPPGRLPALAVVWFVVTISPVSNVLFLSGILLAERTLYLPSVGFLVVVGWLGARLVAQRGALGGAVLVVVFALMFGRAWTRTPTWSSTESVFLTLADEHPASGRAQWMVGDMLASRGQVGRAKWHWARAVSLLDSSPWLLRELGQDAVRRGEERLGEFLLLRASAEAPERVSAARRLALFYSSQGRHAEAVVFARRVVERDPEDVAFWHLLAGSLEATGAWSEALEARERVIELGEDPWQQWLSLARLRLTVGDTAKAREALGEALERAPGVEEEAAIRSSFTPIPPPGGPPGPS